MPVLGAQTIGAELPASGLKHGFGFGRIIDAHGQAKVAIGYSGRNKRVCHAFRAVQHAVHNGLLVNRVLQGHAHGAVFGHGLVRVEQDGTRGDGLADKGGVLAFFLQRVKGIHVEHVAVCAKNQINFTFL